MKCLYYLDISNKLKKKITIYQDEHNIVIFCTKKAEAKQELILLCFVLRVKKLLRYGQILSLTNFIDKKVI